MGTLYGGGRVAVAEPVKGSVPALLVGSAVTVQPLGYAEDEKVRALLPDRSALPEELGDTVPHTEGGALREGVAQRVGTAVTLELPLLDDAAEAVPVGEGVTDVRAVAQYEATLLADKVTGVEAVNSAEWVEAPLLLPLPVAETEPVPVALKSAEALAIALGVGVPVLLYVGARTDGEGEGLPLALTQGAPVRVEVA